MIKKRTVYRVGGGKYEYRMIKTICNDRGIFHIENHYNKFRIYKVKYSKGGYSGKYICTMFNVRDCLREIGNDYCLFA